MVADQHGEECQEGGTFLVQLNRGRRRIPKVSTSSAPETMSLCIGFLFVGFNLFVTLLACCCESGEDARYQDDKLTYRS